jgi:predicted nucleotide-binding protein
MWGLQVGLRPRRAVKELRKLHDQADTPEVRREGPQHESWKAKVDAVMVGALGKDSETLRKFRDLRYHVGVWTGAPGEDERDARFFEERVEDAASLVEAAIYQLELEDDADEGDGMDTRAVPTGPIFVVHGHDDARKYELMLLLERAAAEASPVVLHEQVNGGATILEKFERHAQTASCAVVLLTGDDEGRLRGSNGPMSPRGRQNVILELGVFIGLLGRRHVVVLKDPDVEVPSDLNGLVYISLDSAGAWRNGLMKELAAMGIKVDFSRI